jgi:hypothetical protein
MEAKMPNSGPLLSPTEEELRRDFEAYQRLLAELEAQYQILPPQPQLPREAAEPSYVVEPIFSYQLHAST